MNILYSGTGVWNLLNKQEFGIKACTGTYTKSFFLPQSDCSGLFLFLYFQVKKCNEPDCWYCTLCPPRLPPDVLEGLFFLPDPVAEGASYKSFQATYGHPTVDAPPMKKSEGVPTDADKKRKGLLVQGTSTYLSS